MGTTQTYAGSRAARRASRRPQVQHLITADERSLADLELALATLPMCAVGRVFIEVPESSDIGVITAPPRMTVTWLPRARRGVQPRATGEALSRAAIAWADEMLCDDSGAGLRTEVILLGGWLSTADIVDHLTSAGAVPAEAIHAPARYGLASD
ncbi:SIP domain-containing protein [Microbacterium sp. NPDC055312]